MKPSEFVSRCLSIAPLAKTNFGLDERRKQENGLSYWAASHFAMLHDERGAPWQYCSGPFRFTAEFQIFHEMLVIFVKMRDEDDMVYEASLAIPPGSRVGLEYWISAGDIPHHSSNGEMFEDYEDNNLTLLRLLTSDTFRLPSEGHFYS